MFVKKALKSLIMGTILLSSLYAGELKVKNNAGFSVMVTVRAKENQSTMPPFIVTQIIKPGEEITVTIDEKNYKGTTFSVQGTTEGAVLPNPAAIILKSNECLLTGCEGRVVFESKDGTALVCGVINVGDAHVQK